MKDHQKPADGCLFIGSMLLDRTEFVNIEFGSVRFSAKVQSRTTFRVEGSRDEMIALRGKFTVGEWAPLTIGREYFGNACLAELYRWLADETPSHMELTFVNAEVVPP